MVYLFDSIEIRKMCGHSVATIFTSALYFEVSEIGGKMYYDEKKLKKKPK